MSEELEPQGDYQLVIQNDHYADIKYARPVMWNKELLKIGLQNALKKHKDVVYTEDNIKQAKDHRAELNGLRTKIENERKRVKGEFMRTYDIFEADVKELVALVDEPINTIDAQLDVYEQRRTEEKTEDCCAVYNEVFTPDIAALIPYHEIKNKQWLNKGFKLEQVRQDLEDMFKQIKDGIAIIKALNSPHETSLINTYITTRDMADVMRDRERYAVLDRISAVAAEQPKPQMVVNTPAVSSMAAKTEPEPLLSVVFKVITTKIKMDALKAYIKENNIKIERV